MANPDALIPPRPDHTSWKRFCLSLMTQYNFFQAEKKSRHCAWSSILLTSRGCLDLRQGKHWPSKRKTKRDLRLMYIATAWTTKGLAHEDVAAAKDGERREFIRLAALHLFAGPEVSDASTAWACAQHLWDNKPEDC